jgi:release factor glutamine methyltransferase
MNGENKSWKILELLKTTEELFRNRSISSPRLNAEMLLAAALKTERIRLYIDFEKPLTETELEDFRSKVKRRLNNEPVQYILGKAHFFGLEFNVSPSVLIPRPETELLVEKTIEYIKQNDIAGAKVLEIGTGSGCISVSIAANSDCTIEAIDNSEKAINTAIENSAANNAASKINFRVCDFLHDNFNFSNYDIVVSNPPYIPAEEFFELEPQVRDFEPQTALTDNADGLEFYRHIIELYIISGMKPKIFIEIGDGKKEPVEKLLKEKNIKGYTFHKDLINIYRVLEI